MTKRQKDEITKRQNEKKTQKKFNFVMSGQFRTIAMFYPGPGFQVQANWFSFLIWGNFGILSHQNFFFVIKNAPQDLKCKKT